MLDQARPARERIFWIIGIILAAWLLSPIIHAQHLEGYTTNLKAIALMANRGDLMGQDLMTPALTEFLYYTRSGLVALLRLSEGSFGNIGDWDFRGLMIVSFIVLFSCSVFIAHRLGQVGIWSAVASLLLLPSVSESAFFFNDSVPSAAFAVAGFALVVLRDRPLFYLIGGALAAAAALCRLDALVLAPVLAGIAWLRHSDFRPLIARIIAAGIGFAGLLVIAAVALKATPLDALLTARNFRPGPGNFATVIMLGLFVGAPGALLLPVGLFASLRRFVDSPERLRLLIVLVVHPAIIVGAALKLSTETRYIYPLLTPYVALYGGKGLEALIGGLQGRHRRASLAGLILLALFVLVPPPVIVVRDGPRSPVGRIWMPVFWWRWENAMAESLRKVEALVARADARPRLLLLSTHFNDDFFIKQRLIAAGYQVRPAEAVFPGCSGFSVYSKGPHLVVHVRTERQYSQVATSKTRLRALLIDQALSCPQLWSFGEAYLTVWSDDKRVASFTDTIDPSLLGSMLPRLQEAPPMSAAFEPSSLFQWPFWRVHRADAETPRYQLQGAFHSYPLSRRELAEIARSAKAYLRLPLQPNPGNDDRIIGYREFQAAYAARCKDPKDSGISDIPLCLR